MSRYKKYLKYAGYLMLCGLALVSCTDKDLEDPSEGTVEGEYDPNAIGITFVMELDNMSGTRATAIDEIDNYVDIEKMFQVLCFDSKGDFLFEARDNNLQVTPTPDNNGQWYVTISLSTTMKDQQGNPISLSLVKKQLENDGFKIAVLANWYDKDKSLFKVQWGWKDSKLNTSVTAPKNANDLHHIDYDKNYWEDPKRKAAYGFVMDSQGNMGLKTDWVTSKLGKSNRKQTEEWIRGNWDPYPVEENSEIDKVYQTKNESGNLDLWQLWNFGGSFDSNEGISYIDLNANKFASQWKIRNANAYKELLEVNNGDIIKEEDSNFTIDGLKYVARSPYYKDPTHKVNAKAYKANRHGIILPKTYSANQDKKGNPIVKTSSQDACGYFTFKAPGAGILNIKWSGTDNTNNAILILQRNSNYEDVIGDITGDALQTYSKEININQDPEEIVIFNVGDADAVIYSIEYICDKYLYDTDRQGIDPSEEHPIPMYGVQNFPKIENWGESKVLNLSQTGKYVNLIRALAKVEVYFPENGGPSKIFMRSMNRSARCEPMDVSSPTFDAWSKFTGTIIHDADHCEWFDICNYGSGYSTAKGGGTVPTYQEWFSYFYGSWYYNWDNTNGKEVEKGDNEWKWDFGSVNIPKNNIYPRIFNPSIDRSDFCEFIYKGKDAASGMERYVLYVPDKNVDDPNTAGDLTSAPKVAHIEYRYDEMSDYLDDNDCHRIYFTDYKNNEIIKDIYQDQFDNYEKNLKWTGKDSNDDDITVYEDHLQYHWPIMRNHIYRFYIGSDNVTQEIRVSVSDFGQHDTPKKEEW